MKNITSLAKNEEAYPTDPLEDLIVVSEYIFVIFFGLSLLPLLCQDENEVIDVSGYTIK